VWAGGGQGCGPESGSAFTGPGHCGASVGRSAAAHRAGVPTRVPYGPNHARRAGTGGSTRVRHCASASHLHNYAKCACPARLEPSKLDDPGHRGGSAGVNLAAQGRGGGGGVTGLAYVCGAILTGPTREQARPGEYKFTTWRAPLHPGAPWATHAAGRCTASPERPRPEPTPAAQRTHLGSTACRPGWPTSTATLPSLSRHRGRAHGG